MGESVECSLRIGDEPDDPVSACSPLVGVVAGVPAVGSFELASKVHREFGGELFRNVVGYLSTF